MTYLNMLSKYPISDGWASHIARGSLGGIDFACPVGTPIPAPCDGRLQNVQGNGSGGWMALLYHADGSRDEFLHLSKFVSPGKYKQGDIIGYSGGKKGAPGAGSSTGPHIHWHLVLANGRRVNPLEYTGSGLGSGSSLSGWAGIQKFLKSKYGYTGAIDGIPGKGTWSAMQKFLKAGYGYNGAIDGIPGKGTWSAMQRWLARYYGYAGTIDGIPGPMTNTAIVKAGSALGK